MKQNNYFYHRPVLVTGGAGFIGSHIVEQLVALHAQVTVLDNLSTGSLQNIATVRNKVTCMQGDITQLSDCVAATRGIHTIFHLAARTSVPESFVCPEIYHEHNVTGTSNLLEAARRNGVQRFVLSSSAAVYGNKQTPCTEDAPCTPLSPYGYSKLIAEQYCKQYAQLFGLQTVCLRYFNVYGPRQDENAVHAGIVAILKKRMRENQPITIYGDGTQIRDFVPVQHIAQANLTLASVPHNYYNGSAINVASGASISLLTLIQRLRAEFPGYTLPLTFLPARAGDIPCSLADCTRYNAIIEPKKYPETPFYDKITPDTPTVSL